LLFIYPASSVLAALLTYLAPTRNFALTEEEMHQLIAHMSIEQKVGQLIVVGFEGTRINADIKSNISQHFVGGVTLFARNIQSPRQLARLTTDLQKLTQETEHRIPLFIATDQEGGWVARLKTGATVLPGNMALGAAGSAELAEQAGKITAIELAAVGINLNFAPVMDVNNNPRNPVIDRRSFGEGPDLVSRLGSAYIKGLQQNGVLATTKHFPGHGDTTVDSHTDLPTVSHDVERIRAIELKPFRAAIEANVAAIMTAHIVYSALDADRPATLSQRILTTLLRGELGFDGLIITDDMEMKAIDRRYRTGEAVVMAIAAGADMVLTLWTYQNQLEVFDALVSAVKSGRISEDRINQSVERILKYKTAFGAFDSEDATPLKAIELVGSAPHRRIAATIADQAITVVENQSGIMPLNTCTSPLAISSSPLLFNLLRVRYANSISARIPVEPNIETVLPILARQAETVNVVIAGISNHRQAELIYQLGTKTKTPIIVAAFGSPYSLQRCPNVSVSLAAYDAHYESVLAAVKVMVGESDAPGKLPIQLTPDAR
jgi:beta-N-acetylhexosaminidase